jgi:type II secretory pathway predicted ATPase ExeA/outer membrane protein OmpA-like peptidoglycan-associated protein
MYRAFFKLESKPFEITTEPIFLWLGVRQKEALAALHHRILDNQGFLLLTGDAGTGKTVLLNALIRSFDDDIKWAVISNPNLDRLAFYDAIAKGFGIAKEFTSKVQFLIQFSHFLHRADDEKKKVLLLVDDCHRLSQDMLEELRLLSNIEKAEVKLINILFVGRREFNELLIQPKNRAVRQRLSLTVELTPLTAAETEEYIRHRLKVAGTEENLFTTRAIQIIHRSSLGIPARINVICDHALVAGCVQGNRTLDHKELEDIVRKLDLPRKSSQEEVAGPGEKKGYADHLRGRLTPGLLATPAAVSGFNLESNPRWSWLKYGLGTAVLIIAGSYFWYPAGQAPEIAEEHGAKVAQQTVVREVAQIRSSPVAAMLEKNQDEINEKKAAEVIKAIMEKAYSNGENSRPGEAVQAGGEETVQAGGGGNGENAEVLQKLPAAGQAADPSSQVLDSLETVPAQESKGTAVAEQNQVPATPATSAGGPAGVDERAVMAPEQLTATRPPTLPADQDIAPPPSLEPVKIVLGLAPNSLKLTAEAEKEYARIVAKLKSSPGAKVLIKGFVSATSHSPENTKLSLDRAESVQKMLIASGVAKARTRVQGMGIQEPIASNNTSEGRAKNRRVEVVLFEGGR